MRLVKVHLQGYRRFLTKTTLAVGGQVTVLIGPNEAGKSSLLEAIALFGRGRSRQIAADDWHPNVASPSTSPYLELEFYLTPEEQENVELRHLGWPYAQRPRRLFLGLNAEGQHSVRLDPVPVPNPVFEANVRKVIEELGQAGQPQAGQAGWKEVLDMLAALPITSRAGSVTLSLRMGGLDDASTLGHLQSLRDTLRRVPDAVQEQLPRPLETYRRVLDQFLHMRGLLQRPATDLVLEALDLPQILMFTEVERELKSETELRHIGEHSGMANLLAWGGLDLAQFRRWVERHDEPRVVTALTRTSRRLTEQLRSAWPFEPVGITLQLKDQSLRLLVEPVGEQPFERPERRSDGLRIFLALLAFLARHRAESENTILLVDELELHLHVDAQRQVVQMLEQQGRLGQAIYSTHSPFALPTDWTALRAVRPDPRHGTSSVDNRIWSDRKADRREGLTRLLFQMGAGAAVFNAAQAVLVTEGVTDVALLPRLLAEALGRPALGVPMLPGYSEVREPLAFEFQGARVAYLFDGDRQGREYQRAVWKALARAKGGRRMEDVRPEDRVRVLTLEQGYDLEDYLHPDYYAEAINHHLSTHGLTQVRLAAAELPATDRPAYVKAWAAQQGIAAEHLDKRSLAEALLDLWWEHEEHIDPQRRPGLRTVAQQVVAALHLVIAAEGEPTA